MTHTTSFDRFSIGDLLTHILWDLQLTWSFSLSSFLPLSLDSKLSASLLYAVLWAIFMCVLFGFFSCTLYVLSVCVLSVYRGVSGCVFSFFFLPPPPRFSPFSSFLLLCVSVFQTLRFTYAILYAISVFSFPPPYLFAMLCTTFCLYVFRQLTVRSPARFFFLPFLLLICLSSRLRSVHYCLDLSLSLSLLLCLFVCCSVLYVLLVRVSSTYRRISSLFFFCWFHFLIIFYPPFSLSVRLPASMLSMSFLRAYCTFYIYIYI